MVSLVSLYRLYFAQLQWNNSRGDILGHLESSKGPAETVIRTYKAFRLHGADSGRTNHFCSAGGSARGLARDWKL